MTMRASPEHREKMARAISFLMLGVEDRWHDWLPDADESIASIAAKYGLAALAVGEKADAK
jgi:hypothetical protein